MDIDNIGGNISDFFQSIEPGKGAACYLMQQISRIIQTDPRPPEIMGAFITAAVLTVNL